MKPHEERVVVEASELKEKLDRLDSFISGAVFGDLPGEDRDLLLRQRAAMRTYHQLLEKRIARFPA